MEETILGSCWHCGVDLQAQDYGRETQCLKCGKPTRVCRNCRWFDTGRANQCQEPMAEKVMDKQRANFCEFFEPTMRSAESEAGALDALRRAAEDLFK
jgi:hypothetical protein